MEDKVVIKLLQTIEKGHVPTEHIFQGIHCYDEESDMHIYRYFDEQQKKQEMLITFGVNEAVVKIIGASHSSYIPLAMNQSLKGRYVVGRQLLELSFQLLKLRKTEEIIEIEYNVVQNKKNLSFNSLTIEVIKSGN